MDGTRRQLLGEDEAAADTEVLFALYQQCARGAAAHLCQHFLHATFFAYWRISHADGVDFAFVLGRTRCAPLTILTIPRQWTMTLKPIFGETLSVRSLC